MTKDELIEQLVSELTDMPDSEKQKIFEHVGQIAAICLDNISTKTLIYGLLGTIWEKGNSAIHNSIKMYILHQVSKGGKG